MRNSGQVIQLPISEEQKKSGIYSGLLAAFLLGWAPILGKFAYRAKVNPTDLAVYRTISAALLLWFLYMIFWRKRTILPIKDIGLCLLVGAINGVGSLFYYNGLGRMDASRAALLSAMIPVWVVIFLSASGQKMIALTWMQLFSALGGVILVTSPWASNQQADLLGVMLIIASAAVNGWYFVMGQWVLSDIPSRSATLYIITGMAITVFLAKVITRAGGGLSVMTAS
ncbi:MAG: DMT family transporter, partial [Anaerolineae bacterium]|nr:DMT family transporter [Anaerolineae bacterium]